MKKKKSLQILIARLLGKKSDEFFGLNQYAGNDYKFNTHDYA